MINKIETPAYTERSTCLLHRFRAILGEYGVYPTLIVDSALAASLERIEWEIKEGIV